MNIKLKKIIIIWICFSIVLTSILMYNILSISSLKAEDEVTKYSTVNMEEYLHPKVQVVEKEVIVEKVKDVYQFPFEVEELGSFSVIGVCKDCIENKKYENMRGYEGITAFADESVLPEGSLIWIENVGILQVQTVYSDYKGIFVYFDNHSKVEEFGEQNLLIFEVKE